MNVINLLQLPAFDAQTGLLNTVVETPKGNRSKYNYDSERGLFKLKKILPAGAFFPFDFGFVPGTLGEDNDPLDILILKEEPSFPGCVIPARLIGVIEARQVKQGKTSRNDRLIGVADGDALFCNVNKLRDLSSQIIKQIEHFFVSYNLAEGKKLEIFRRADGESAKKTVLSARNQFLDSQTVKPAPSQSGRNLRTAE
jgi:inorganic pyrophosphatase